MKKFFLLTMLMAFGLLANAQYTNHWTPTAAYPDNMTVFGPVELDGSYLASTAIEIGAFCDNECRGSVFLEDMGAYYGALQTIVGANGDLITFRLYDHAVGQELDVTCHTTVTWVANDVLEIDIVFTTIPYYNITASATPAEGGTVSGGGMIMEGAQCTLVATANFPYVFDSWTKGDDIMSHSATYTFTVTEAGDYVAHFTYAGLTITAAPENDYEGTVTGGGIYMAGQSCTLTATANEGFAFTRWSVNGDPVTTANPYTFTVTESKDFIAEFHSDSYYINVTCNPTEGGTVTGAGLHTEGTICTLVATPATNYSFVNWTENGTVVSTNATYAFNVIGNRSLVANFHYDLHTISVTCNPAEGGTVTGAGSFTEGATCTLVATPAEGYVFASWTEDGNTVSTDATYAFTVSEDRELMANFAPEGNNHHWIPIGGFQSNMNVLGYVTLDGVTLNSSAYEVGVFCGNQCRSSEFLENMGLSYYMALFTIQGVSGEAFTFRLYNHATQEEVQATCLSTVLFEDNATIGFDSPYEIQFVSSCIIAALPNPSAGGTVTGAGTYDPNTQCTLTATANEGYTFINWTKDNQVVSTDATYIFTVTESATYYANFELNTYAITATADPAVGGTVTGAGTHEHGSTCTLTATANTGYNFLNWTKDDEVVSTDYSYSFTVTEDAAYVAHFEPITYQIEAIAQMGDGTVIEGYEVNGVGNYYYGTTCTLSVTSNEGLTFVDWKENGVEISTEPTLSFTVTGDRSLVATFTLSKYWPDPVGFQNNMNVLGYPTMNGEIFGNELLEIGAFCGDVCRGSNFMEDMGIGYLVLLTVCGDNGDNITFKAFDHVTGEILDAECFSFVDFETNATIGFEDPFEFEFVSNEHITATVVPEESGTVEGTGVYLHGTECALTAVPNEGYGFLNWTLDGVVVSTANPYTFTAMEDAEFVANFEVLMAVTATVDPAEGGTVDGVGLYSIGAECTLTAVPNIGYVFINWTLAGEEVSTEPSINFTVTENIEYTAHFELTFITQTSHLDAGMTWWSGYVVQDNLLQQIEEQIPGQGNLIKSQNNGTRSYLAGAWRGTMSPIVNDYTYMIKVAAEQDISVMGFAAVPSEHPIELVPGWTWVGFPCPEPMDLNEALAGFTPQNNDVLKTQTQTASFLFGQWRGGLANIGLTPGEGMMYKSNNSETVTLTYANPTPSSRGGAVEETPAENHWTWNAHNYATNMSVLAVVEMDGVELKGEQYEVAAFANGECRGSFQLIYIEPIDRYMAFLTLAGDEAVELNFGLYDANTGEECLSSDASLMYEADAVIGDGLQPYVIRFRGNTGVNELANRLHVYPNPVEHGQTISLGLSNEEMGEVRVEIMNALGAVVETVRTTSIETIAAPTVPGVYTLRVTVDGKDTCCRKLVVR
jgi:hypothetical protein